MFKKFVSVITVFAVLLAFTPAAAADTVPTTPTIESILDEYQEKAFAAPVSGDTAATAAYSPRSGDAPLTLEQETVNELTAAGYEAYNVTDDNYDAVEEALNTDLASLGINDDGSYIVALSGDATAANYQPGFPSFNYTYEGVTYALRYVTVQANDSGLLAYSDVDLFTETGETFWEDIAGYSLEAIAYVVGLGSNVASVVGSFIISQLASAMTFGDSIDTTKGDTLEFAGGTNWTVVYTQVFNYDTGKWSTCASVEYVKMRYWFEHRFFNPNENAWDSNEESGTFGTVYSDHYYETSWRKEFAVLAYTNPIVNFCEQDIIDYVAYEVGNQELFRHYRDVENFSMIPGLN